MALDRHELPLFAVFRLGHFSHLRIGSQRGAGGLTESYEP